MGIINRYKCIKCGHLSKEYFLGPGMFDTISYNVWSCVSCAHTIDKVTEVHCRFFPNNVRKESMTYNIDTISETPYDLCVIPDSLNVLNIPHVQYILNHKAEELDKEQRYIKEALENNEVERIELKGRIINGRCKETGDVFAYEIYHEVIHLKCSVCGGKMINGVVCPDCKIPMNEEEVGNWD